MNENGKDACRVLISQNKEGGDRGLSSNLSRISFPLRGTLACHQGTPPPSPTRPRQRKGRQKRGIPTLFARSVALPSGSVLERGCGRGNGAYPPSWGRARPVACSRWPERAALETGRMKEGASFLLRKPPTEAGDGVGVKGGENNLLL